LVMNVSVFAQLNIFKAGAWYSIAASHSGKALEIKMDQSTDSSGLQQNDSTGQDNQLFQFKKVVAGYYRIIVKQTGKVLQVKNCSVKDHEVIVQSDSANVDCQLFATVKGADGTLAIIAKNSGYGFDILGGVNAKENNTPVIQYPVSGAKNQFFRITEIK